MQHDCFRALNLRCLILNLRCLIKGPQVCRLKNCLVSPSLNKVDLFIYIFIYLFVLFNAMTILEASAISVFKSVKMILINNK